MSDGGFLDSSVLVRYLTGTPPAMAKAAASIIDQRDPIIIVPLVLAETGYVLMSVYGVPVQDIVDTLTDFLQKENIVTHHLSKARMIEALQLCRPSRRVSFTDALLWAMARESNQRRIYSFDKKFPSQEIECVSR